MIQNLYSESEQDIDRTLLSLSCLVDKDYGLIKKIKRVRQYYDEPKFWYYSADLNDSFLKNDGYALLAVKARSIDVTKQPKQIFKEVREKLEKNLIIIDYRELEPFQKDHCMFICKKKEIRNVT